MASKKTSELPADSTPLDPDEAGELIPSLTTINELNAFEQLNIARAVAWSRGSIKLKQNLLSIDSLKLLHKKMFNETWRWAGRFRITGKNIGVEPHQIQTQLAELCKDGNYWLANNVFSLEECAVKFHHRLVSIHPFPNGNGRHARLVADLLMFYSRRSIFSWGGHSVDVEGVTRIQYIKALREADRGNYESLLKFALGEIDSEVH